MLGFNGDDPGQTGEDGPGLTISTGSPELMNNNGLVQQVLNSSPLSSPTFDTKSPTPARVVVQIEPPASMATGAMTAQAAAEQFKTDKPRKFYYYFFLKFVKLNYHYYFSCIFTSFFLLGGKTREIQFLSKILIRIILLFRKKGACGSFQMYLCLRFLWKSIYDQI